ncbi:MAG: DNA-binding NarL/FixJ family response regulator [Verrucomicrobiales bacterium]|jgi:DNA-binding NarL/FixJ family response regulator
MEERSQLVIIAVEHQELRHSLRRLIGDQFERMIFADDYQSLVDTISSTTPDLLLVELSLPTDQGMNVLRALQKAEIALPTIAIGDYDDEEALDEIRSTGAAAYVLRTKLSTDILPAISEALIIPAQPSIE